MAIMAPVAVSQTVDIVAGTKLSVSIEATALMHVACITAWGESPKYLEVPAPESPDPETDNVQVRVKAAAVHKLVHLRASGRHYSAKSLPHIPGVDGIGVTSAGNEVYFFTFGENSGSYAEVVNISRQNLFTLPSGADRLQIAGLVNPAMSSWMALRRRTITLPEKFTVLILGATTISGILAAPIARQLGAGKVIGCARNQEKLDTLGLDQTIRLCDPATATDFSCVPHVDIILDYLYGPPAAHFLGSLKTSCLVQYINIGDVASPHMTLHSKVARSSKIMMSGAGVGSWSINELREEMPKLLRVMTTLTPQSLNVLPLSKIETAWDPTSAHRTIFVP
ncbi:hypothetical protein H2200_005208 [Cladophialophora chaetospira]|uniref:Uncharacterized protein n=1 Tax=Cladophialophora chaetospira TaxID=386627 RepID=A0AA38XBR1_9EURO|nr:hypothetical protein H2200_005208 [Cladophialophora chaetospira]